MTRLSVKITIYNCVTKSLKTPHPVISSEIPMGFIGMEPRNPQLNGKRFLHFVPETSGTPVEMTISWVGVAV
jgi:hypothetical protein